MIVTAELLRIRLIALNMAPLFRLGALRAKTDARYLKNRDQQTAATQCTFVKWYVSTHHQRL